MRRSICFCEPSVALAGQMNDWRFVYTTASGLPKGAKLKFDIVSKGRDIDWEVPDADPKAKENAIYAQLEDGTTFYAKEVETEESFVPQFEFVLPKEIKAGGSVAFLIGRPKSCRKGPDKAGNRGQTHVQRRRPFLLYIDPKGKGFYEDPEVFLMDIRGNVLSSIRVLTPSIVGKNKRFDVTIRFEDAYGNLTANAPEDTLVELTYEQLRENLNWKIFVPETGFITLPNLYFNEEGIYTIQLNNMKTGESFYSAPIRCVPDHTENVYWGLLHGESERVDSAEDVEACLRHFRDEKALNFFGTSPFEGKDETPMELWKTISQNVAEFNDPDRFVTMLGFQWVGKSPQEGVRHFLYSKDNKSLLRQSDTKYSSLKKIYKQLTPSECMAIPSFSMGNGMGYDFSNYDPEFEKVVEIYNSWGASECTTKDGNTLPISKEGRTGIKENPDGAILEALKRNCRFGFVAGGLDDRDIYAEFYDSTQIQYSPGLTAIIAADYSRDTLFKALQTRSCYATTGERILLGVNIAGSSMGQEISTGSKPGLKINRHISGYVAGTVDLESVEIVRNGEVIKSFQPDGRTLDFEYDDLTPIESIALDAKDKNPPFVFYYVRVTQTDGHRAWSSPIWIDIEAAKVRAKRTA